MAAPIRILVAIDSGADRDTVEAVIPEVGGIELASVADGLQSGWTEVVPDEIDAVLVATGPSPDQALAFTEGIASDFPDLAVLLLHPGSANGLSRRALAAGAEDVVTLPVADGEPPSPAERERVSEELLTALEKGVARRRRATAGPRVAQGRMIAVVGPKGGAGKTLVSTNLAVALAEAGEQVVVLDLDLQFGDAGLVMGLAPTRTIYDLVMSGGSIDAEKLDDYMTIHESGARVLQAPARPDQATAIDVEFLRQLFAVLRATEDWIIVDSAPGFTPEVIAGIDAATDICMVGTVDAASLKNTKLGLETLELMGVGPGSIRLVLNRSDSRVGITPEDVHAVTGRPADFLIPSHRDVARSANDGRPIVRQHPGSDPAKALRSLAGAYMGAESRAPVGKSLKRVFARGR
jgi:pilus assembly protein CpaE